MTARIEAAVRAAGPSPRTTILLADDHGIVRQAIRGLLESQPDFEVVGEASDGLAVAALVDRHRPDILVVDISMPGLSGLDAIRDVALRFPATRVVVLSMHGDRPRLVEALRNGAAGYVIKEAGAVELTDAIRTVSAGGAYLSSSLGIRDAAGFVRSAREGAGDPYDTLTMREREALHLAAEGLTNARIGKRLFISPRTAEKHRASAMKKLGLRSQHELLRYAQVRRILPLDASDAGPGPGCHAP